jgi:hypothetical protein
MELEKELHQILKNAMQLIEAGPEVPGGGASLAEYLRRIDQIKGEWGKDAPPMLQHYLEKRSYTKALDFLEGRDGTLAPNC